MSASASLNGITVLVLEDDFYTAEDSKDALEGAGATVLGPFGAAPEALADVQRIGAHCALVDINLGRGPDFGAAASLLQMGVAVILMTGYDHDVIPEAFADLPCLQKPTGPDKIVAAIVKACGR